MAAFTNTEASSSFSKIPSRRYDVFLSFSGSDTRKKFTGHLLAALERNGFYTFRDDTKLRRGEVISCELLKAIEGSKLSIIVFSKNYASSRWCLDELVKIIECKNAMKQMVLPIFYDVDPADVRSHKGFYAQAFAKHEKDYKGPLSCKVIAWKHALTRAANLSGYVLKNVDDGDEAKFIYRIVDDIASKLDPTWMEVAQFPIGVESRVLEALKLFNLESNDVQFMAIWGIGGIGKTTLAKAIYNSTHREFEGSSFLANVSAISKQINGLELLQEKLISSIMMNDAHKVKNEHHGIKLIEQRIWCRKVLIVLDDVDDVKQLRALAICRQGFHTGSLIIITTRNMSALSSLQLDEKHEVYSPQKLNEEESLQLFSWHCFRKDHSPEEFKQLLEELTTYARGLPLVVEILGSFLSDKSKPEWRSELEKLKKIPNHDVQGRLKLSFDSLDERQKGIFLDIACYFIGIDQGLASNILKGLDYYPESDIKDLSRRCLVKVVFNQLTMHDLIRDMGREIIRQESENPGKRSRLLYHDDVLNVLRYNTGTETVKGLVFSVPKSDNVHFDAKAFAGMSQLKLLHLKYVHLSASYEHLSKRLVWLSWMGFPLDHIPSNLHMEGMVALNLYQSKLKQVWKENKILDKLKFLNLSHSYHLTQTPDFSGLVSLEILLLSNCKRLIEIHHSIWCLSKLVVLDLKNCKNLLRLPRSIFMLTSLEYLDISGCAKLESFPGFKGSPPKSWYSGFLSRSHRDKIRDSICISPTPIMNFSSLRRLKMQGCNFSFVPSEVGSLVSLKALNLGQNQFSSLPASIRCLTNLEVLFLDHCPNLQAIPALPISIRRLHANYCTSLEAISLESGFQDSSYVTFYGCGSLVQNDFANNFRERLVQFKGYESEDISLLLHRGEIPDWFEYQSMSALLSFVVPPLIGQKIRGWIFCVVFAGFKDLDEDQCYIFYHICNKTKDLRCNCQPTLSNYPMTSQDNMWLNFVPHSYLDEFQLEAGDEIEFSLIISEHLSVKKCGVNLIYMDDDQLLDPSKPRNNSDTQFHRMIEMLC